jgi:predicted patatin/cPLA2 family phospholipase
LITESNIQTSGNLALVVEGGGMRSIFSAGVLDSFYEQAFDPFTLYLGVSAGSLNLTSHLAGQYLRNYRVIMFGAKSGDFINGWNYLRGGHYVDLDWLSGKCFESHPLNDRAVIQNLNHTGKKFFIVCTNFKTGQPIYYRPNRHNIISILRGSCCLPVLYRNPIYIHGHRVFDGGIVDPLPVQKACKEGAKHIIVIRSRSKEYRETKGGLHKMLGAYLHRESPALGHSINNHATVYNESVSFINNPPTNIKITQIVPTRDLATSLTSTDPSLLERDYQLGKEIGNNFVKYWQDQSNNGKTRIPFQPIELSNANNHQPINR